MLSGLPYVCKWVVRLSKPPLNEQKDQIKLNVEFYEHKVWSVGVVRYFPDSVRDKIYTPFIFLDENACKPLKV
jgi:hypothetical protein